MKSHPSSEAALSPPIDDTLSERRHVAVVVRGVVDSKGRLLHAEVVAVEDGARMRVVGWRELYRVLRLALARHATGA